MHRSFPLAAGFALAAVPAIAATPPVHLERAFLTSGFVLFVGLNILAALIFVMRRRPLMSAFNALIAVALLLSLSSNPAFAQATITAGAIPGSGVTGAPVAASGIVIPWGQWIADYGPQFAVFFASWISGVVTWALAKWAPWSTSVLTQQRVEQAAQALAQYGVKAVANSTKDGKVTIKAGPAVLQAAVQRGVNVLPSKVVKAMIEGGGMTSIIFRALDLEETADEHQVLQPAIRSLKASDDPKLAKAA